MVWLILFPTLFHKCPLDILPPKLIKEAISIMWLSLVAINKQTLLSGSVPEHLDPGIWCCNELVFPSYIELDVFVSADDKAPTCTPRTFGVSEGSTLGILPSGHLIQPYGCMFYYCYTDDTTHNTFDNQLKFDNSFIPATFTKYHKISNLLSFQ